MRRMLMKCCYTAIHVRLFGICRVMVSTNRVFCVSRTFLSFKLHKNAYCYKTGDISLHNPIVKDYLEKLKEEYKLLLSQCERNANLSNYSSRLAELQPLIQLCDDRDKLLIDLEALEEFSKSGDAADKELDSLIKEERDVYKQNLDILDGQLMQALLPKDNQDKCNVIMEVSAGVGGQEAMLFAKELYDMYTGYMDFKGWQWQVAEMAMSDIGGLRHASVLVFGDEVYRHLKHEAGVHRVQRIPTTERSGRVHTSTVAVVIMIQPEEVEVQLKDKDLRIETKRASGAGGQHVNTTDSAVRVTHIPTGIVVECQVDRSQVKNRQLALQRLKAKLYQHHLDEQLSDKAVTRKQQVKSNLRSEKIRTYNFNQDRITDHRLGTNLHNMQEFMHGGELLDLLIQKLGTNSRKKKLLNKISEMENFQ